MSFADAQITDPAELQVLDILLLMRSVVVLLASILLAYRTQSANDSTTMPTSRAAVQYLVPYSCDCKSIKTQTNSIGLT